MHALLPGQTRLPVIIHRTLLLAVVAFVGFLILAMRTGGVVPEDYVDSQPKPAELKHGMLQQDWRFYGHDEWVHLAVYLGSQNRLPEAEQAAKQALAQNPGYGPAAAVLVNIYARMRRYDQADYMLTTSSRLWPARHKHLFENNKK